MTWLSVLNTVLSVLLTALVGYLISLIKSHKDSKRENEIKIQCTNNGLQALLRAQLINDYNKWHVKGYAPIYVRENFENCYNQYHALGGNGVMTDLHDKFMDLPTDKTEVTE